MYTYQTVIIYNKLLNNLFPILDPELYKEYKVNRHVRIKHEMVNIQNMHKVDCTKMSNYDKFASFVNVQQQCGCYSCAHSTTAR